MNPNRKPIASLSLLYGDGKMATLNVTPESRHAGLQILKP